MILVLVHKYYGHVVGAIDFFDRILDIPNIPLLTRYSAPASRVAHLKTLIRDRQYSIKQKTPLQLPNS